MHVCAQTLKLNFRLCPLAEELGLEHSRLCSAARREAGRREGLCDCTVVWSKKGALTSGGQQGGVVLAS